MQPSRKLVGAVVILALVVLTMTVSTSSNRDEAQNQIPSVVTWVSQPPLPLDPGGYGAGRAGLGEESVPSLPLDPGGYGAGRVGPGEESVVSDGVVVDQSNYPGGINGAKAGDVVLVRGGSYSGGFAVPVGVTVKPFNGEKVTISGQINMGSDSTVAGLYLTSSSQWVIRVSNGSPQVKRNVTIRNNDISGGSVEAIRVSRNVKDVLIVGNDIYQGGNHNIKIHGEGSGYFPSAVIRNNRIRNSLREDGIQTEDNGSVTIDQNTFDGAAEDNIDIKSGTVAITRNLFLASTEGAVLVHGEGTALIENNKFVSGRGISLGSKNTGDPSLVFRNNYVEGSQIWLRRSFRPVTLEGNTIIGGTIKVGFPSGDYPRILRISGNALYGTELIDRASTEVGLFVCTGNTIVNPSGDWSQCG
jgi:Right handed beta helix region